MKHTALIMAGGRGERFWPKSRRSMPKQFLSLSGDGKTMIQNTIERVSPLVKNEDIYIVTNKMYRDIVLEQLPNIPADNILCEPMARNTAPCIGLGAVHIQKKYGDALMHVFPSDHLIKYQVMFLRSLEDAARIAEEANCLVTLGITPTYPEVGYGYIKFNPSESVSTGFRAEQFTEKPNLDTAKRYVESEMFLWNSGIFTWKVSTLLNAIEKYEPELYLGLLKIKNSIDTEDESEVTEKVFRNVKSLSIDYAIMEKADNIAVLPSSFGWDDVGSWLAVERVQATNDLGNTVSGDVITVDTRNTIIQGGKRLIATVGIEDTVIVDSDDAVLVCDKNSVSDIKKVLENLKICNRNEYL